MVRECVDFFLKIGYNIQRLKMENNMKTNFKNNEILKWVGIFFSSIIYSLGIALFLGPNELAPGGASGAAIIISTLTGIGTGLLIILINTPLFIAGFFKMGKWFLVKTIYAVAVSSFFIDLWPKVIPEFVPVTNDKFLAAVAGAVLCALGIGLIFRFGGSTGGTDIVAKLLRRRFPSLKTGSLFLIVDSIIVIASVFATGELENALYAGIALFITSYIMDKVLYGTDEAKLLIIISTCPDEISELLLKEIDAGVTFLDGQGAYTHAEKKIIICAVRKQLFHKAKQLVCKHDPSSFIIVSNASEIFGEGYKTHSAEEL